MEILTNWHSY